MDKTPIADTPTQQADAAEALRSIVGITASFKQVNDDFPRTGGSGYIVAANIAGRCEVVTDNHTLELGPNDQTEADRTHPRKPEQSKYIELNASQLSLQSQQELRQVIELPYLTIHTIDGTSHPAVRELVDRANDVAVLRVVGIRNSDPICKGLTINSNPIEPGRQITALSYNFMLRSPQSASASAISEVKRSDIPVHFLPGEQRDRTWQSFALIGADHGDSGGAMVDGLEEVRSTLDAGAGVGRVMGTPSAVVQHDLALVKARAMSHQHLKRSPGPGAGK